jgi:hypothetical protein
MVRKESRNVMSKLVSVVNVVANLNNNIPRLGKAMTKPWILNSSGSPVFGG